MEPVGEYLAKKMTLTDPVIYVAPEEVVGRIPDPVKPLLKNHTPLADSHPGDVEVIVNMDTFLSRFDRYPLTPNPPDKQWANQLASFCQHRCVWATKVVRPADNMKQVLLSIYSTSTDDSGTQYPLACAMGTTSARELEQAIARKLYGLAVFTSEQKIRLFAPISKYVDRKRSGVVYTVPLHLTKREIEDFETASLKLGKGDVWAANAVLDDYAHAKSETITEKQRVEKEEQRAGVLQTTLTKYTQSKYGTTKKEKPKPAKAKRRRGVSKQPL